MKRLQNKVQTEQATGSNNVFGSLTFDRRTFFECSNRMKRLVPTLSRRQNGPPSDSVLHPSQDVERRVPTFNADEDDLSESEQDSPPVSTTHATWNHDLTLGTAAVNQKSPPASLILQERHSNVEVDASGIAAIATLPRNSGMSSTAPVSGSTATLPTSFPKQKSTLGRRRIWLKPLTSFVTFMSSIGDNIHITSYPTP